MKRLPFIILLLAVGLQAQIKKPPIEPIKPPVEKVKKAQFIIEHQDVTIDKVNYQDAKLVYEFNPVILTKCDKKKLVSMIDGIKTTAEKLTVEYRDDRLGKMSQVFLGKMPKVIEFKEDITIDDLESLLNSEEISLK
jgi:hypothetical protein